MYVHPMGQGDDELWRRDLCRHLVFQDLTDLGQ